MLSLRHQFFVIFCVCVCLIVWRAVMVQNTSWVVTVLLSFTAAVCIDIYRLKPSPFHTYKTLLLQYVIAKFILIRTIIGKPRFDKAAFNVEEAQTEILFKILKNNAGSTFSKEHKLDNIKTVDEFRKTAPLSSYADYLPYLTRAIKGESNVFFPQSIDFIGATTGTTSDESKKYPKSTKHSRVVGMDATVLFGFVMNNTPGLNGLQKWLWYNTSKPPIFTSEGIRIGPISTMTDLSGMPFLSTPQSASRIINEEHKTYIDLLFGVRDETIMTLNGFVSTVLLKLLKSLERHWKTLCDDIERGTLYSGITIDDKLREELESLCRPDPIRAAKLRQEFEKGFDGIIPRIWPNCKLVFAISSGTFQVYADIIKEKYLGDLILFSQVHASTEGIYGVNIWPEWSECIYSPVLGEIFYEWLPVNEDGGEPVLTHQVELGKEYELVVTTVSGLYRYRTEDIVKFTKRYYHLPLYEFVRRKGDMLNVYTEKVPESLATKAALETFADFKDVDIVDYTFVESIYYEKAIGEVSGDMYYVIFAEMDGNVSKTEEIAQQIDEKIRATYFYGSFREKGIFKQLKVLPLCAGAFSRFKNKRLAINKLAGSMQFKVPRILRKEEMIRFFEEERQSDM